MRLKIRGIQDNLDTRSEGCSQESDRGGAHAAGRSCPWNVLHINAEVAIDDLGKIVKPGIQQFDHLRSSALLWAEYRGGAAFAGQRVVDIACDCDFRICESSVETRNIY